MSSSEVDIADVALRGSAGLADLVAVGRFAAPDPVSFRWDWREVRVDGFEIVEWTATPMSGSCKVGDAAHTVVMVAVVEGLFRYEIGPLRGVAPEGSVLVLAASDEIRFNLPQPTRCLRVAAPAAVLPQALRLAVANSVGMFASSPLTQTLALVLEAVLDPAGGGSGCPAARAVRSLVLAALEQLVPTAQSTDLRIQMIAHVEAHLTDPDLAPRSIADAFGISVRWVHHVFSEDGQSVARFIRQRRLELVAALVRSERRVPHVRVLAARSGFASRDQMTRAFRAEYGMTIADYAKADLAEPHQLADRSQGDEASPS